MLKHSDIINKLTERQKINILTDISALFAEDMPYMALPKFKIGSFEKFSAGMYPSAASLAKSWDKNLVSAVSTAVLEDMSNNGVSLALADGPKVKLDPYGTEVSEDPLLASKLAEEYVSAAEKADLNACLTKLALKGDDTDWLDILPNQRTIAEHVVKPFADVAKDTKCKAIMADDNIRSDNYEDENYKIALCGVGKTDAEFVLCESAAGSTVKYIQNGVICLKGSEITLESALKRYYKISRSIEKGSATQEDLDAEVKAGRAISPQSIDDGVDRVLELVFSCTKREYEVWSVENEEAVAKNAAYGCCVLLQNRNNLLPLSSAKNIAVIGDIGSKDGEMAQSKKVADILAAKGYNCIGWEKGYNASGEVDKQLISDAVRLASRADAVLLFLGVDTDSEQRIYREKNLRIPAVQCALAHALKDGKNKVIAVLPTAYSFDISDVEDFAAVLLTPFESKYGAYAAADIIAGSFDPCGHLTSTLYRNTDYAFAKQRLYHNRGMRTGPFVGYRYYDTADYNVGYPFGHGLSYGKPVYYAPSVSGNRVKISVRNPGKNPCATVIQVYVGKKDSNVIRPKKELAAFEKVQLAGREKKTLELELSIPEIYNADKGVFEIEAGAYNVYIGESVTDIKYTLHTTVSGVTVAEDGEAGCNYLQSESNIISDNFTLEAKYKLMKKTVKNIICGSVLIGLAVALQVYCNIAEVYSLFMQLFSAALVVVSAVFFISEALERRKANAQDMQTVEKENSKQFADAQAIETFSTEEMFKEEFDKDIILVEETKAVAEGGDDSEYFTYVDQDFTFESAVQEFVIYAAEHGVKFDLSTVRDMFAAMTSSRLLLVNGMDESQFKTLVMLLAEYFESAVYIDKPTESCDSSQELLFSVDEKGMNKTKTSLLNAMETAKDLRQNIHIAAMTDVGGEVFENGFAEIIKYAKNPKGYNYIYAANEKNIKTPYYIPQNVWLLINTKPNMPFESIGEKVLEAAAVINPYFVSCPTQSSNREHHKFKYYQLDYLSERVVNKFEVDEEQWKKVDRLSGVVNRSVPVSIGNKQWLGMEKFAAVYLAAGGDRQDTMDRMLAARVIPSFAVMLSVSDECDELVAAVDEIFGDGNVEACRKVLKDAQRNRLQNKH